jgi:hypothetical protein
LVQNGSEAVVVVVVSCAAYTSNIDYKNKDITPMEGRKALANMEY